MTHTRAVFLMVFVAFMWSTAGVVTRHLDAAHSFEVAFWRSFFMLLSLSVTMTILRGAAFWRCFRNLQRTVWISGIYWSIMFTSFMVAITLTAVANVLVTMALNPLMTALFARVFLHHKLPLRTWVAIIVAGLGIAWMFGNQLSSGISVSGTLVALLVPLATAMNFTTLQYANHHERASADTPAPDMVPALLIGGALSVLGTLTLAYPFQASAHDLGLLALLGSLQLTLPCLLLIHLSQRLPAPEIALLGLLEVILGVTWTWLGAGEQPSTSTLIGGALVLGALVINELLALLSRRSDAAVDFPVPPAC